MSPKRVDGKPDKPNYEPMHTARAIYAEHAKEATEILMHFISNLFPDENPLCVTYFDEAHELGILFWIMLRLLQAQEFSTRMWYVFMGTKSSITYYSPFPENRVSFIVHLHLRLTHNAGLSLKLRQELSRLVPPYIALDFDQQVITRDQTQADIRIRDFQSIQHLAQYGRPLYAVPYVLRG